MKPKMPAYFANDIDIVAANFRTDPVNKMTDTVNKSTDYAFLDKKK